MDPASVWTKLAKLGLDQVQRAQVATLRGLGAVDFPIPPNSAMRKTGSKSIRHYVVSGIQTALPIATCALREGIDLRAEVRVLDFGCGVGRQLAHLTRHFQSAHFFACDIDEFAIEYIRSAFPSVHAHVNAFSPPLAYENEQFDLVYSISIFSHLSIEDHRPWLDELARVTRRGGLCLLSIEGRRALRPLTREFGMPETTLSAQLNERGYLYQEYKWLRGSIASRNTLRRASSLLGVEGSYGSTVLSAEHVRRHWDTDSLEVVAILEGIIDYRQDLVVLRRR